MLGAGDGAVMERADIKKLQVLVVGGKPHAVTVMRTAFGIIGLNKVHAIAGSQRAIQHLRDEVVDAVFCDEAADAVDGVPFPLVDVISPAGQGSFVDLLAKSWLPVASATVGVR